MAKPNEIFVTLWTVAYQASPSMGFFKEEYWSGLPFSSPGNLLDPGTEPGLPHCRQMLYHLSHQGSPNQIKPIFKKISSHYSFLKYLSMLDSVLCTGYFRGYKINGSNPQNLEFGKRDSRLH